MPPSVCVTTSYDAAFAGIGDYAALSIRHYAAVHGFAAHIETEFVCERPPAWRRVQLIPELFDRGFDFVFWIDADAVFTRFDRNILKEMPRHADLALARGFIPEWGWKGVPSTGVMFLRNSDWTRRLLSDLWANDRYANRRPWENGALIAHLGLLHTMSEAATDEPRTDLLAKIHWLDIAWNTGPNAAPNPIITHWAGRSNEVRRRDMPRAALEAAYRAHSRGRLLWRLERS